MKSVLRYSLILLLFLVTTRAAQAQVTANPEAWRQDLRFFVNEVTRRHANFYNTVTPTEFAQAVNDLDAMIPFKSDADIHLGIFRLAAMAKDAHTAVSLTANGSVPFFRRFPIWMQWFQDGLYLTNVSYLTEATGRGGKQNYRRVLGARLVKIGETPIAEVIRRVSQIISYENDYWLHVRLPYFVITPEVLQETRVVENMERIPLTFAQANGQQITITPPIISWNAGIPWTTAGVRTELPLYRQNTSANYWYKILDDSRTLWLQYNRCADAANNPMTSFAAEMFRTAETKGVMRFVIDLRNNTGGNSEIIRPVLNGLLQRPWLNQRGRVYVITGNTTFSSGLWGAIYFQYYTSAILLGEPTGGKPNSYGEVLGGLLPNSKIGFQYSTKLHNIVPGNPIALFPDVPIETSAGEYINHIDLVMSYILAN